MTEPGMEAVLADLMAEHVSDDAAGTGKGDPLADDVSIVARVINQEGGAPGNSLHSWRCEYPGIYGPCDCVEQTAREILAALRGRRVEMNDDYLRARGVVGGTEPAEDVIRRLRGGLDGPW